MAMKPAFRRSALLPALALLIALGTSPAYADRCDDLAGQLKSQIDGLGVGKTAANVIYLSHPAAKDLRLGCASRKVSNELLATSDVRKAKPEFLNLVAKRTAESRRRPFSISSPAPPRLFSRCRKTTCAEARPAASSEWELFTEVTSRPGIAVSTCVAREQRPKPRSRSRAAGTNNTNGCAERIATILGNSARLHRYFSLPFTMCRDRRRYPRV